MHDVLVDFGDKNYSFFFSFSAEYSDQINLNTTLCKHGKRLM